MMKFFYQFEDRMPKVEITLDSECTLTEAIEEFEKFLKAAGYEFDGVIDIVPVDDVNLIEEN